jgi:uncharacterized membrane protein
VEIIAQLENAAKANRSRADRIADRISSFVGSMSFVYLHVVWFALWLIWNSYAGPEHWRIDPYPYTFLTFVVSLEAIFLSTFILVSQNHEEMLARRRNHLDLQINLLSEQENSQMIAMLIEIKRHLKIEGDPKDLEFQAAIRPEQMAAQIEDVIEAKTGHKVDEPKR